MGIEHMLSNMVFQQEKQAGTQGKAHESAVIERDQRRSYREEECS